MLGSPCLIGSYQNFLYSTQRSYVRQTYATISAAMTESPARPLILTSAVLLALFVIVALLPGNPVMSSIWGFAVVVVVQALIIWRLWQGRAPRKSEASTSIPPTRRNAKWQPAI